MERNQQELNQLGTTQIELFNRRLWSQAEMEEWYCIDFGNDATMRLVSQAAWFGGTENRPSNLRDRDCYDHWHWEVFLQRRNLMVIRDAAAQLSMSIEQFREITDALAVSASTAQIGTPWADYSNSVVNREYLRSFHRAFPNLQRVIFRNHSAYIERVHREIFDILHVRIETTEDLTDVKLGENPPRPGYYVDCITGEPVGLGHEISLSTRKPLELGSDYSSWITYANLTIPGLESKFDHRPGLTEEILNQLRAPDAH